jgi:hypothetical protein
MPKGSADYNQAIAANSKPEWEPVTGKDFRKYFKQWDGWAKKVDQAVAAIDQASSIKTEIADPQRRIAEHKAAIKQSVAKFEGAIKEYEDNIEHDKAVKLKKKQLFEDGKLAKDDYEFNINYRNGAIAYRQQKIAELQDQSLAEARKLKAEIANNQEKIAKQKAALENLEKNMPKAPVERLRDNGYAYETFTDNMQGRSLVGVKQGNEMGAAAAIIPYKHYVYIDYLMTNPKSMIEGSKGAGTAAIKAVVKKSMDMGKSGVIKLYALPSAMPFYEKLGFTRDDPRYSDLTLSAEAAKKLLGD